MNSATKREKLKGVDYVVDERGEKKAVIIDLRRHRGLWEDFHDTLVAKNREDEPRETLDDVKKAIFGEI
jgi:hypothetical protein